MQFVVDPFLSHLEQVEATVDPDQKYKNTMHMLMSPDVRATVGAYLARFGLGRPRDVLAMVMVALNCSMVLELSAPQDMIVRAESQRFLPAFKSAYATQSNPTICVQRALEAFAVWKEADKDKIITFTQDQIVQDCLNGGAVPPPYWARILVNSGVDLKDMWSLYGPSLQVHPTTLPCANPGQLFSAVEDHLVHPYLKQYVRLRAPNGPCNDEVSKALYLQVLERVLGFVHRHPVSGEEAILQVIRESTIP